MAIAAAVREHDFVDNLKKESKQHTKDRYAKVLDTLDKRQEAFKTPHSVTAFALDARIRGLPPHKSTDEKFKFPFREVLHQASFAARKFMEDFFSEGIHAKTAQSDFDDFCEKQREFASIPYPEEGAPKAALLQWWRCKQPSPFLRQVAEAVLSLTPSQGVTERFWALLSRQCIPLRSKLSPTTKCLIASVAANWRLVVKDAPAQKIRTDRTERNTQLALEALGRVPQDADILSDSESESSSSSASESDADAPMVAEGAHAERVGISEPCDEQGGDDEPEDMAGAVLGFNA